MFKQHYIMKFVVVMIFFIAATGFKTKPNYADKMSEVRLGFYDAVIDSKKVDLLDKKIEEFNYEPSLLTVYKGATYAIKAKNQWNPFSALRLLGKSIKTMDEAVKKSPSNLEIRFIRFAVQKNIPSYLGYSDNVDEDKKYLIKNIDRFYNPELDKKIRDFILKFMTTQGGYNEQEVKLIRQKLLDEA